eukprot:Lankesteria_metandrocarpae@DN2677_c0_g1_i1.p1
MGKIAALAVALSNNNADGYSSKELNVKKRSRSQTTSLKDSSRAKRRRHGAHLSSQRDSITEAQISCAEVKPIEDADMGLARLNQIFSAPLKKHTAVVARPSTERSEPLIRGGITEGSKGNRHISAAAVKVGTTRTTRSSSNGNNGGGAGILAQEGRTSQSQRIVKSKKKSVTSEKNAVGVNANEDVPTDAAINVVDNRVDAAHSADNATVDAESSAVIEKHNNALERRKWTVFVGNVKVGTTPSALAKTLQITRNEYDSIYFRSMPLNLKYHNNQRDGVLAKGYSEVFQYHNAYILCRSEESYAAVLAKNGTRMGDDVLRLGPVSGRSFSKFEKKRTVFVGNMPFTTTETELYDVFNEVGSVDGCRIVRDSTTCFGKGFGFVCFHDAKSWRRALKSDTCVYLQDRKLRITKAVGQTEAKTAKQENNTNHQQEKRTTRRKMGTTNDKKKPKFVHAGHQKIFLKPVQTSE